MNFVLWLLLILKVVFLAVGTNGEFISPQISNSDLKSGQHDEWIILLEEKPPYPFKPGEGTVHQEYVGGEALSHPGIPGHKVVLLEKSDKMKKSYKEQLLFSPGGFSCGNATLHHGKKLQISLNLRNPHLSKDRGKPKIDLFHKYILRLQPDILEKVLSRNEGPAACQTFKLCSTSNSCCISETLTWFGDMERRLLEIPAAIHSQPIPVKMKM